MRAVVFTAIFGNYDDLKEPVSQDAPCDFVCFTDGILPSRMGSWRVIRVATDSKQHPRLQAKRYKILSDEVFPNGKLGPQFREAEMSRPYDLSIWIDANRRITGSGFVSSMRQNLGGGDWAMFVHPDRDCLYDEADVCMSLPKCQGYGIPEQIEAYRTKVPPHGGLHACTVIVRREPLAEHLSTMSRLWWDEINNRTLRDQLSLPYLLALFPDCKPVLMPEHMRANPWFEAAPHNFINL